MPLRIFAQLQDVFVFRFPMLRKSALVVFLMVTTVACGGNLLCPRAKSTTGTA